MSCGTSRCRRFPLTSSSVRLRNLSISESVVNLRSANVNVMRLEGFFTSVRDVSVARYDEALPKEPESLFCEGFASLALSV